MKMILSIILSLMLMVSIPAQANQKTWRFKVFLEDKEIGSHTFQVSNINNQVHATIQADFNVYVLFINAYHYQHRNYEVWEGACLKSIHSTTNDNGEDLFVRATKDNSQLTIESTAGAHQAKGCIKSFAYWDPDFLNSQALLNAQTGEILPIRVELVGQDSINVRNQPTKATHYRIHTDKFSIDLWYSDKNEWLALNSTTENGAKLRYEIQ